MKKLSLLVVSMVVLFPVAAQAVSKKTGSDARLECLVPNGGIPEKTPPTSPKSPAQPNTRNK